MTHLDPSTTALAPLQEALSPMALNVHRASSSVVGRQVEQDAIHQELASVKAGRLTALTLEGEPGIGKPAARIAMVSLTRGGRMRRGAWQVRPSDTRDPFGP